MSQNKKDIGTTVWVKHDVNDAIGRCLRLLTFTLEPGQQPTKQDVLKNALDAYEQHLEKQMSHVC